MSPTEKKVTKGVVAYPFVFAKIQPQNYRFSLFSNPQTFLLYLFSFPRWSEIIGLKFFFQQCTNSNFFIFQFLLCLKCSSSGIRICLILFPHLTPLKRYLKNIRFLTVHTTFLDIFCTHFDCMLYTIRCRMGYTKDKLVLFFPQKAGITDKLAKKI